MPSIFDGDAEVAAGDSRIRVRCSYVATTGADHVGIWRGRLSAAERLPLGRMSLFLDDGRRGTIEIVAAYQSPAFEASFRGVGTPPT